MACGPDLRTACFCRVEQPIQFHVVRGSLCVSVAEVRNEDGESIACKSKTCLLSCSLQKMLADCWVNTVVTMEL